MSKSNGAVGVVLGGGGLAGVGWMVGVLAALEEAGTLRLAQADRVIGTSAGAAVGALLLGGRSASSVFDDMVRRPRRTAELAPAAAVADVLPDLLAIHADDTSMADKARRFAALSRAHAGVNPVQRRQAIGTRIGLSRWPTATTLLVTAVDTDGQTVVFDRDSGVDVVDAVTASCAVPALWPVMTIHGTDLIDGGTFSGTNAELAAEIDRVLVLRPQPEQPQYTTPGRDAVLRRATVLEPSARARAGFGDDPFDPDVRGIAAVLGYDDGAAAAAVLVQGLTS